jgi:hypothetical protein
MATLAGKPFTKAPRFFVEQLGTVEAIEFLSQLEGSTEEALIKAMERYGDVVEKNLKKNIDADVSDTGRLAASIGHYDPNYIRHEYADPEFGRSTPADAYYQPPTKKGGLWSIIIGTNVWYAAALEFGIPRKGSGNKPVKLKNGMWRRLKDAIPRRDGIGLKCMASKLCTNC